ncbi:NVEALA domain-containing protein, partial [Bacteroides cellulosilyticus]
MKKFMKIAFVAAFAAIAGYGVYANQKVDTMSDLMLANVEALARYEVNPDCPNGCTSGNTG